MKFLFFTIQAHRTAKYAWFGDMMGGRVPLREISLLLAAGACHSFVDLSHTENRVRDHADVRV